MAIAAALLLSTDWALAWDCYAPKPGHPTKAEREAFIVEMSELATRAERDHGVPAPAIVAMAIVESGYGFTRTALNANNLFGWKFVSSAGAGGREAWRLDCQPDWDPNNRYVAFASRADSVDYVGSRLAKSRYYRDDLERYRSDIDHDVEPTIAVDRWVDGIADPYNFDPPAYAMKLKKIMRLHDLYRLTQAETNDAGFEPRPADIAYKTALTYLSSKVFGPTGKGSDRRYLSQNCAPNAAPVPGYDGFPVQRCRYTVKRPRKQSLSAIVYLLNPSPKQAARWVATACRNAGSADNVACAMTVSAHMWCSNNLQFPVSGIVIELASEAGFSIAGDPLINIEFRDGVSADTGVRDAFGKIYGAPRQLDEAVMERSARATIAVEKSVARVAGVSREAFIANGGTVDVGRSTSGQRKPAWRAVSRDSYLAAWSSNRYSLLDDYAAFAAGKGYFERVAPESCPSWIYATR